MLCSSEKEIVSTVQKSRVCKTH